jgi:hypothetical protein
LVAQSRMLKNHESATRVNLSSIVDVKQVARLRGTSAPLHPRPPFKQQRSLPKFVRRTRFVRLLSRINETSWQPKRNCAGIDVGL